MKLLSISSFPTALLHFTYLKAFSNSSKVRSLYFIFFCTGNRKSSNVLDVFCILLKSFFKFFKSEVPVFHILLYRKQKILKCFRCVLYLAGQIWPYAGKKFVEFLCVVSSFFYKLFSCHHYVVLITQNLRNIQFLNL